MQKTTKKNYPYALGFLQGRIQAIGEWEIDLVLKYQGEKGIEEIKEKLLKAVEESEEWLDKEPYQ